MLMGIAGSQPSLRAASHIGGVQTIADEEVGGLPAASSDSADHQYGRLDLPEPFRDFHQRDVLHTGDPGFLKLVDLANIKDSGAACPQCFKVSDVDLWHVHSSLQVFRVVGVSEAGRIGNGHRSDRNVGERGAKAQLTAPESRAEDLSERPPIRAMEVLRNAAN
jgi:hypothetical protein